MNTESAAPSASYLEPSPEMRELQLLELLADRPNTSQSALAALVGLTPARVNAYIRAFVEQGYVAVLPGARAQIYNLTHDGKVRLAFHQVSYRAELVRLSALARMRFRAFFDGLQRAGHRKLALYGAGETGEVVLDALSGYDGVEAICVIDDDAMKQGARCHGIPVVSLTALTNLEPDAVVITSIAFDEAIRARLAERHVLLPQYSLAN